MSLAGGSDVYIMMELACGHKKCVLRSAFTQRVRRDSWPACIVSVELIINTRRVPLGYHLVRRGAGGVLFKRGGTAMCY